MYKPTLAVALMLVSHSIFAATWQLESSASTLNFSSSKTPVNASAPIVEENHFDSVSGTIDAQGKAVLTIDLTSVDTRVPLRDERLEEYIFDTKNYPTATFTTQLDMQQVAKYDNTQPQTVPVEGILNLRGTQHTIKTQVTMQEMADKTIQVKNTTPVVIDTQQYNMQEGVNALQTLMTLQNISPEIPVTFTLVFKEMAQDA